MNKRAVSFLDYALVLTISSLALIAMFTYVKRGLQTKVKGITDGLLSSQQEVETITGKRTSATNTTTETFSGQELLAGGASSYTLSGSIVISSEATVYDKRAFDSHGFTSSRAGSVVVGKQISLQNYMLQEPLVDVNLEQLQQEKGRLAEEAQYLSSEADYLKQESLDALTKAGIFLFERQNTFLDDYSTLPEAYAAEYLAGHFTKYWGEYYLGNMAVDITGGTKMTLSGPVVVLEGELKKIQKEIDKLNEEKALRSQADALIEQGIAAENNDDALGAENLRLQAATLREQAKLKRQQFYSLHKNRLNWKKGIVNGYAGYAQSMDTYYSTTLAAHIHYDIAYWWGWGWWPISWRVQFVSCALDGDNDSEYLTDQPLPAAKNDLIYQKAPRWHKQAVLQQQILANIQKRLGYVVDQEKNDAQIGLL